jgi:hypothetical protein
MQKWLNIFAIFYRNWIRFAGKYNQMHTLIAKLNLMSRALKAFITWPFDI